MQYPAQTLIGQGDGGGSVCQQLLHKVGEGKENPGKAKVKDITKESTTLNMVSCEGSGLGHIQRPRADSDVDGVGWVMPLPPLALEGNRQQFLWGLQHWGLRAGTQLFMSFLFPQEKGPQRAHPASCRRNSVSYTWSPRAFPSIRRGVSLGLVPSQA